MKNVFYFYLKTEGLFLANSIKFSKIYFFFSIFKFFLKNLFYIGV